MSSFHILRKDEIKDDCNYKYHCNTVLGEDSLYYLWEDSKQICALSKA